MANHADNPHSKPVRSLASQIQPLPMFRGPRLISGRVLRFRYIYDLYYKREAISKELYEWLLKQEYADAK